MGMPGISGSKELRRQHAPLLLTLAWKNVRLRYKSSLLGFVWSLLNPLLFLLIFLLGYGYMAMMSLFQGRVRKLLNTFRRS